MINIKNYLIAILLSLFFVVPAFAQYIPAGFSTTPSFTTITSTGLVTAGTNLVGKAVVVTRTAVADAAHTQITGESIIAYTSLTATRNVTLITAGMTTGQLLMIKDESGAAGTFPITTSGVTIDGANPSISTNFGVLRLYYNGATYSVW